MDRPVRYHLKVTSSFQRILTKLKRRHSPLLGEIDRSVEKILTQPELGKPLRHNLKNFRRIHIEGSFVLLYEIHNDEVRLIDFDHHDKVYKKYA